jgi:hypothetical protein
VQWDWICTSSGYRFVSSKRKVEIPRENFAVYIVNTYLHRWQVCGRNCAICGRSFILTYCYNQECRKGDEGTKGKKGMEERVRWLNIRKESFPVKYYHYFRVTRVTHLLYPCLQAGFSEMEFRTEVRIANSVMCRRHLLSGLLVDGLVFFLAVTSSFGIMGPPCCT